ncbi:MAG: DUF1415 family protein [Saprospiraceae bacterium]
MDKENHIIDTTKEWINRFVIGLNLCPFAKFPYTNDLIKYSISEKKSVRFAIEDCFNSINLILNCAADTVSNTFVILPNCKLFEDILILKESIDDLLEQTELSSIIQCVAFHPDFVFHDESMHASGNFTNRSPYAMMHFLRVDEVRYAIAHYDKVHDIPKINQSKLNKLGIKRISEIFEDDFLKRISNL